MQRVVYLGFLAAVCAVAGPVTPSSSFTFDLTPLDGNIAGPPGSKIGWGYLLSNSSPTFWLVPTALDSDAFLYGSPNALFDFPFLGPGMSIGVDFVPLHSAGLYEFRWDASAPIGFANTGTFRLSAEWWNGDPLNGGVLIGDAGTVSKPYSVAVTDAPEVSCCWAVGVGLLFLLIVRRRSSQLCSSEGVGHESIYYRDCWLLLCARDVCTRRNNHVTRRRS